MASGGVRQPDQTQESPPSLVVPRQVVSGLDMRAPENAPDGENGEWSRDHMIQFLARQPRQAVYVPKESWESRHSDTFLTVGYNGHFFTVLKGSTQMVPAPIAEIIEQSQQEFPTSQSKNMARQVTDIRDLPPGPRGMGGVEVMV